MSAIPNITAIDKLIVHEIPKNLVGGSGSPILSDVESPLDKGITDFFSEHLIFSIENSFPIEFFSTSTFVNLTDEHYKSALPFIEYSKKIAVHLYTTQKGYSSPGLLCVAACKTMTGDCIGLMKLEKEEGLQVQYQDVDGLSTISIVHIRDLMLTNKTRLFKSALISPSSEGFDGWVSDQQRPGADAIAKFFLTLFLGAKLLEKPETLTKDFMNNVEEWIRSEVYEAEKKSRYQIALMAELNSNKLTVTPQTFIRDHIDEEDGESILNHLASRQSKITRFPKNNSLIRNRLKRIELSINGTIKISCPTDEFERSVKIADGDNGKTLVWINGQLTDVRGK